jgi:hypothetical protein
MRPVSKLLDFLANGAHLIFGSLRLHNDQHNFTWDPSAGTAAPSTFARGAFGYPVERKPDILTAAAGEAAPQVYRRARLHRK